MGIERLIPYPLPDHGATKRARKLEKTRASDLIFRLKVLDRKLHHQNVEWNRQISQFGPSLTGVIFRGEPVCYDFLNTTYGLSGLLEEAAAVKLPRYLTHLEGLNYLQDHDFFSKDIGGVTLREIARLPTPLSPAHVLRVDRLFFDSPWTRLPVARAVFSADASTNFIRQLLVALATHSVLQRKREGKDQVPKNLHGLRNVMVSYLDFYTREVIKPEVNEEEDRWLMLQFVWHTPKLRDALGCYIPARLGITPSSAAKLYQARAENGFPYSIVWRGVAGFRVGLAELLSYGSQDAYTASGLPRDLQQYQHYHPENDLAASEMMEEYYQKNRPDSYQRTQLHFQAREDLRTLDRYRQALMRDINKGRGRLTFNFPPDRLASSLTLTCQNRQVLIFVFHLRGSPSLTLEVAPLGDELDANPRVYGIPPRLLRSDPHIPDLLLGEVLPEVLKVVKASHPELEPPPLPAKVEEAPSLEEVVSLIGAEEVEGRQPLQRIGRILPRVVKVMAGAIIPPKVPRIITPFNPVRKVIYYRGQIVDSVGKKIPEKEVRRMEKAIRRFEFGQARTKHVAVSDNLMELRAGDFRVFLEHQSNNCFSFHHALRRDKMDKPRWEKRHLAD